MGGGVCLESRQSIYLSYRKTYVNNGYGCIEKNGTENNFVCSLRGF